MGRSRDLADGTIAELNVDSNTLAVDATNNRVGIGTSSPSYKLSIQDSGTPAIHVLKTGSSEGWVRNIGNMDIASASGGGSGQNVTFSTGANYAGLTTWVTITGAGELLHNVGGQRGGALSTFGGTYNNPVMSIRQPNTSGTFNIVNFYDGDDNVCGYIGINTTGNTVSYNTSSDYRLKENVVEVTDGIDRVKLLKPSRFNFIADPDTTVDGFLAHEVSDVVPEAIHGTKDQVDKEGDPVYQGIDQSKLVPLLTAALKEAVAKIESLETEMITVKSRLDALESA